MVDKLIYWLGSSKDDLANFPEEARRKAGFQLRAVQHNLSPTDFKSMPTGSKGVEEVRSHTEGSYRIFSSH